ncbi:hypothetical protein E2C01_054518 [Portunus trituberculatus]|uniref:Uncharacterized protein n=1 Tax=Portunus trituberculatus TaxID=210409 RepID=A0A5B7GSA6_PORTR|nr:hypothetical protein [Portunus trituberculatus]
MKAEVDRQQSEKNCRFGWSAALTAPHTTNRLPCPVAVPIAITITLSLVPVFAHLSPVIIK